MDFVVAVVGVSIGIAIANAITKGVVYSYRKIKSKGL